ncbi:hypothetical protein SAMN04244553_0339 [Nocardia amikacinitolerans]|uniref:Uncharacterized protein n=1 Tax=Nocardia amikacinitolerans TaxID=756689 RepID=A0A285KQ89_9NOCA|nr:DUF5995 family protein [Nocardia amikacinitolerans]SNY74802.1 hypothetical protein SAMN04244553_0339 [Nocardia amikacinitolerans]
MNSPSTRLVDRSVPLRALVSALALVAALVAGMPAPPAARAFTLDTACGTPLSAAAIDTIIELSDTSALTGTSLQRLEQAVDNHQRIAEILVEHRDRRGLLALGLDVVERSAVMPLQRDPAAFDDREWAHNISLDLLSRFLRAVHAEFTGAAAEPQWAHYFALTKQCHLSAARVAMAGYNAHLTVDLSRSVAAVRGTIANAPDYFRIVDAIASNGFLIVDATKATYGGDLGPLWRFYFLGEGLDAALGAGVATVPLLRLADAGANVVIFGNGLALQDPALAPTVRAEMDLLWRTADTAFEVLAALGGL